MVAIFQKIYKNMIKKIDSAKNEFLGQIFVKFWDSATIFRIWIQE